MASIGPTLSEGLSNVTVKDMAVFIDRTAFIEADGLDVQVQIKDMRVSYGEVQAQVVSWTGVKRRWVAFTRLQVKQ